MGPRRSPLMYTRIVEMRLSDEDPDYPVVTIVRAHVQRK